MSAEISVELAYGFVIPTNNKIAMNALSNHLFNKDSESNVNDFMYDIERAELPQFGNIIFSTSQDQWSGEVEESVVVYAKGTHRSINGVDKKFNAFGVPVNGSSEEAEKELNEILEVVKSGLPDATLNHIIWMNVY